MHLRGSLYDWLKLVVMAAFMTAGAACTSSGLGTTSGPTRTATPSTTPAPTSTPTATAVPGITPIPFGFSLTPGQMTALGRSSYALAKLASGEVLLVGGTDINGNVLATVEVFYSAAGSFRQTAGSMPGPRWQHSATL